MTLIAPRWKRSGALVAALSMSVAVGAGHAKAPEWPVQQLEAAPIPAPVDRGFAGVIELDVDATDVDRMLFNVRLRLPVQQPGTVTLLYPRWETSSHGPSLTVTDLAGLVVSVDGQPLRWRRDPVEPHAFHLDIPAGARTIEAKYQVVAGADVLAPDLVVVPWQRLVVYPAGWYARNLPVRASVALPPGLQAVSALDAAAGQGGVVVLPDTPLETLLDSPLYAARHITQVALDFPGAEAASFDLMAARASDLAIPPGQMAALQRLLDETAAVFGPPPFRRYRFLARMEDDAANGGSEHRSSSELSLPTGYFSDWASQLNGRDIIAHELVHAWNGLYRVPADLWTPTPNSPQGGSLLWAYEGQSEFWARILAARAGLRNHQETLDQLALDAVLVSARPGRTWRSLSDDVNYPAFMLRKPVPWQDWQRRKDYYPEGVMLWLAVDARLRELSEGAKGIDDFARAFFAGAAADAPARTYTFDSLCDALESIVPGDWSTYLRGWIDGHGEFDTLAGLRQHGWALAYAETPTATFRQHEAEEGITDLSYSLGLKVNGNGVVRAVSWEGPAFQARLAPGSRILEVHGEPFSNARLAAWTTSRGRGVVCPRPARTPSQQCGRRAAVC
ncbi:M61 family metallopeptidase [Pseudoxanthomonas sp. J35]|uniref:M61 family metallopeptidase n=1 Tax=Pseudoxanthomonas sp. J35 TaxID=935852 RepID=UPI0004AC6CD8|nr:M61 family metallopeptidase [Pseudoxanthomonas sp. J35]